MAGIGFALKKVFQKDTFSNRALAYLYSSFIAAGPWIISVISINILLLIMKIANINSDERNLFSATIVYSFLFSQLLVAPIQLVVTRYISDKLYLQKYQIMRPTFIGVNNIVFSLSVIISIAFYFDKPLPMHYKILSAYLFIIISMIWVIMIFLSAVKNYKLIGIAYLFGGSLTVGLIFYFLENPIYFDEVQNATNFLLSYILGLSLIFIILLYNFFSTFFYGNSEKYDFIKYFGKYAVLSLIGLFYTSGLWIDNLIMWFSVYEVDIYGTFIFAPFYDNAIFLSYLTTIVTLVLFLVIIETEFYETYREYYGKVNSAETLKEINKAKDKMIESLKYNLFYTFMIQLLVCITVVLLANPIFKILQINYAIRDIFKFTTIGALFNISAFINILVLLYFEKKGKALSIAIVFFTLNTLFTLYFRPRSIDYTGLGFTIASAITYVFSTILLHTYFSKINYETFALQPIYLKKQKDVFAKVANKLNDYTEEKSDKLQRLSLRKKKKLSKKLNDKTSH